MLFAVALKGLLFARFQDASFRSADLPLSHPPLHAPSPLGSVRTHTGTFSMRCTRRCIRARRMCRRASALMHTCAYACTHACTQASFPAHARPCTHMHMDVHMLSTPGELSRPRVSWDDAHASEALSTREASSHTASINRERRTAYTDACTYT